MNAKIEVLSNLCYGDVGDVLELKKIIFSFL